MSDPVLSQLTAVESDLSQQVESLESELTRIREQRSGLRTVIDMFEGADGEAVAPTQEVASEKESDKATGRRSGGQAASKSVTKKEADLPEEEVEDSADEPSEEPTEASTAKQATKKPAQKKKKDGRAANWQKYVQSDYRDLPLPEAVSSVLRSAPSEIFTIADVMSSIFTESMPRTSYLKARNRISNILSAGARDGTWYRGRNGRYSQSASVEKLK